jgi:hypothetical protein
MKKVWTGVLCVATLLVSGCLGGREPTFGAAQGRLALSDYGAFEDGVNGITCRVVKDTKTGREYLVVIRLRSWHVAVCPMEPSASPK